MQPYGDFGGSGGYMGGGGYMPGQQQYHQGMGFTGSNPTPCAIIGKQSGLGLDACQTNNHGNHKGDLIIYDYMGAPNQQWVLQPAGAGVFIKNVMSGYVLTPSPDGRVVEAPFDGSNSQQWQIQPTQNNPNEVYIVNLADGRALDVNGEGRMNNTSVLAYPFHGRDNQVWKIGGA